jgi:hypothetical protein
VRRTRQHQLEQRAADRRIASARLAAVLLDDAVADRQAEPVPPAHRLGGEEGIEQPAQVLRRDAQPLSLNMSVIV